MYTIVYFEVDSWKDKIVKNSDGEDVFIDEYDGKEQIKVVREKNT